MADRWVGGERPKLYVLPVERACNASCRFCITDHRGASLKGFLELRRLWDVLERHSFQSIELTGGGEPTLHSAIGEIVEMCVARGRTRMYTHGALLRQVGRRLEQLEYLCLSIAHWDPATNFRIMGVDTDIEYARSLAVPKRVSLLLHRSGISTADDVFRYLEFASGFATSVVIRQMFDHDYPPLLQGERVSSIAVLESLNVESHVLGPCRNPVFRYNGIDVEVELRDCASETANAVLHADGLLYEGWSQKTVAQMTPHGTVTK